MTLSCLECSHAAHPDGTCEEPCWVRDRFGFDGAEEVTCGCEDSWTTEDARRAGPTTPDPWAAQGPVPPPPF